MIEQAIPDCARCGSDHGQLLFDQLERPMPRSLANVTHWARCPTNGQPILLSEPSPAPPGQSSSRDAHTLPRAVGSEPLAAWWEWTLFAAFWLGVVFTAVGGAIVDLGLGLMVCGIILGLIAWNAAAMNWPALVCFLRDHDWEQVRGVHEKRPVIIVLGLRCKRCGAIHPLPRGARP